MQDGIDIFFKDKHPLKADIPISVTVEGIDISIKEEQLSKASHPIDFNDALYSNETKIRDEQLANAYLPIDNKEEGSVTCSKEEHSKNE